MVLHACAPLGSIRLLAQSTLEHAGLRKTLRVRLLDVQRHSAQVDGSTEAHACMPLLLFTWFPVTQHCTYRMTLDVQPHSAQVNASAQASASMDSGLSASRCCVECVFMKWPHMVCVSMSRAAVHRSTAAQKRMNSFRILDRFNGIPNCLARGILVG